MVANTYLKKSFIALKRFLFDSAKVQKGIETTKFILIFLKYLVVILFFHTFATDTSKLTYYFFSMKKLLFFLSLCFVTAAVMAVPAKKGLWKTITLADGTSVRAHLVGDEFGHCWLTADGQRYVAVGNTYQKETEEMVKSAAIRRAKVHQRRVARLPRPAANGVRRAPASHLGKKKGLILLVNFKDVKFQERFDHALYENVANTPGYTDSNGFKGSVSDYFKDQSGGLFELTFDVVGPVTVSKKASYYGQNDSNGDDMHAEEMVMEAVKLAKSQVSDWKQYDWDNDDYVDQVMIIFAGSGEASSDDPSTIWPHEYALSYGTGYDPSIKPVEVANNLYVNTYAVANEGLDMSLYGGSGYCIDGIGTICHEFSHCLGLPDMYDVSYSGLFGMGRWSLMDSGSFNLNGFVPSGYTSYDKYSIGWITPTELTTAQEVQNMRALTESNDVYIIKNAKHPDEYYLLESRQQKGWDAGTPAKGMLILHVDYDADIWDYNLVNSYSDGSSGYPKNDHERCTIFHADGVDKTALLYQKLSEEADFMSDNEYYKLLAQYDADLREDVYPQPGNNQLTNTSKPRAFLYNNNTDGRKLMNISITDITQNDDGTMSFKFALDDSGTEEGDNTEYSNSPSGTTKPDLTGALFYESFDNCEGEGGNDGSWKGTVANGTFNPDNDGWVAAKAYGAYQCARFGTGSTAGKAVTPAIAVDGEVTLSFWAGAWDGRTDATELKVAVSNGTVSKSSLTMSKGAFTYYELTINASGNVAITFSTSMGRFFLDEVLVKDPNASSGIHTVTIQPTTSGRIYTLDGRYVGTDMQQLKRGLYIVNGKKVVR